MLQKYTGFILLSLASMSYAGEIKLMNGDVLKGELTRLEGNTLYWKSETFGELKIDKQKVAGMETSSELKINGHSQPCLVDGMKEGQLLYHCEDGNPRRIALVALDIIQPYEEFAAGVYEYNGKLAVSGVQSSGNNEQEDWDVYSKTSFRKGDFRHVTGIDYESKSVDNGPVDEVYEVKYRLDWFFHEKWFWYNEAAVGADDNKRIDESYMYGSGIGYQLWKSRIGHLDLELGFDYTKDHYDPTPLDLLDPDFKRTDEKGGMRYATDFRYGFIYGISIIHRNEFLASLEDGEDWELSADTGLNIPLGAGLFSEFMFEYDYDNMPQGENERIDTKFKVGIGYEW